MSWLQRILRDPAARFVALFALYLGIEVVVYPAFSKRWFFLVEALTVGTTWLEAALMGGLGAEPIVEGNRIYVGGFGVHVIEECTGIFEAIIYAAAVLAYPTSGAKKALGFALGLPLLYLFNLLRIAVLLWVGSRNPERFEFMHVYFWQATLILMITSVWLLWIFQVVRRGPADTVPAA